ncbi:MAG: Gfo/Idh/MocA family oxidoreductase [Rubripirellula sp.]|nr:Gfo/Idh/MocA family oxidoreductase [Rubripirellula sp.]
MDESQRFRVLVLSVVKHAYIPEAVAAHRQFELVAVADQVEVPDWIHERNQKFAERYAIPYLSDIAAAIEQYRPDVAVISSEAERHCELAVEAAKAGLHIVIDKPLSNQLEECDRLVDAVQSSGVRTLVWNRNFMPAVQQTLASVQAGRIGKLRAIHCDFYFAKDAGPLKGSRSANDPPLNWLKRQIDAHADGSDGAVGMHPMGELEVEGIYPLAYIRALCDAPVKSVFARTAAHFHQAHVDHAIDDLATVTLEMEGGIVGSLCLGRIGAASHPDLGAIKLHLIGSEGSLVVHESRPEVASFYRGQPVSEFPHRRVADQYEYLLMEEFATAIETGSETSLDVTAGREICRIVDACLRSARSGGVIQL